MRLGTRQDGTLIQLSSDLAEREFSVLAAAADNVSRVDVAVTVKLAPSREDVARLGYDDVLAFRRAHPSAACPTLHQNGDGGATLEVGDRASDWFLRVYNKAAECRIRKDDAGAAHYDGCWRYELEVKGPTLGNLVPRVPEPPVRAEWAQALVHTWAKNHGLEPVFPWAGNRELVPGFRRRSDAESRMEWLRSSVRPSVAFLRTQYGRDELLHALDLEE